MGSLIAFGTAAIYVSFLMVATAALIARLRGSWSPAGHVQLGRLGLAINIAAVIWLAFETINIAWPRSSLAPPGAPFYQVWAAPLALLLVAASGFFTWLRRDPPLFRRSGLREQVEGRPPMFFARKRARITVCPSSSSITPTTPANALLRSQRGPASPARFGIVQRHRPVWLAGTAFCGGSRLTVVTTPLGSCRRSLRRVRTVVEIRTVEIP